MSDESKQRCPHDGGYCHHNCGRQCHRQATGMALTTPHPGFPILSDAPVSPTVLCDRCHRPRAGNFDEARAGACPREWAIRDRAAEEDCERVVRDQVAHAPDAHDPAEVTLTLTCSLKEAGAIKLFEKLHELGFRVKE